MSEFTEKRLVLEVPGMNQITKRSQVFKGSAAEALNLDVYHPSQPGPAPAVVFISGYPDPGFRRAVGCNFKDMGFYVSWAQLAAASGMVGITYENLDPAPDAQAAVNYVFEHADELGVDPGRIAIWSCSGNAPTALSLLTGIDVRVKCAVLCYGYLMDVAGASIVRDAANQWGFSYPLQNVSFSDIQPLPLLLVRAGLDETSGLNESLDQFITKAVASNHPLTLINYPEGCHAFDQVDDSDASRAHIRSMLKFLRVNLDCD